MDTTASPPFIEDDERDAGERFVVDLDGYEGPLDVLLVLAREQKVDLARLSILELADQYLAFIIEVRRKHLDLAADYLVMAAWLAYLKSRLLLPAEPGVDEELPAEEAAAALAFRLRRLEAMRAATRRLQELPRLGDAVFGAGQPEGVEQKVNPVFQATLYDLLRAYGNYWRRRESGHLRIEAADLYSVDDALRRLRSIVGTTPGWFDLRHFLPNELKGTLLFRSAVSAHFVAALELARQGKIRLRQDGGMFSPLYVSQGNDQEEGASVV